MKLSEALTKLDELLKTDWGLLSQREYKLLTDEIITINEQIIERLKKLSENLSTSGGAITRDQQIVLIAYLSEKLGVEEEWFVMPNEILFGKSPYEVVMEGEGDIIIKWLEERLGLRPGVGF